MPTKISILKGSAVYNLINVCLICKQENINSNVYPFQSQKLRWISRTYVQLEQLTFETLQKSKGE